MEFKGHAVDEEFEKPREFRRDLEKGKGKGRDFADNVAAVLSLAVFRG